MCVKKLIHTSGHWTYKTKRRKEKVCKINEIHFQYTSFSKDGNFCKLRYCSFHYVHNTTRETLSRRNYSYVAINIHYVYKGVVKGVYIEIQPN